jgi:ABC-type dipeptide/oligopeptide/nickel transport system permease subunit
MSLEKSEQSPRVTSPRGNRGGLASTGNLAMKRRAPTTQNRIFRELRRNRAAGLGVLFMILILFLVIVGPYLIPYEPHTQILSERLSSPSSSHWLGTDQNGRDVLSRIASGGRISLFVGLVGTAGGLLLGTTIGLCSGYFGGWTDNIFMRFIDIMYAFPGVLLAIMIVAILGPSLWNLIIALTIWATPTLARIVRSNVLSLKQREFVEAAHAIGASPFRIMTRHLLLNTVGLIIVYATLGVATAILTAAALGFLGLGVQPPTPEWGSMLSDGRTVIRRAPYLTLFPGLAIFFTVLSLNFIGDALRDASDPYSQR